MPFKIKSIKFISIFTLLFALWPVNMAIAHPHILIDARVKFHIQKAQNGQYYLDSLHYIWQFDENFSLLLLGDYDDNQNQLLEQDELTTMGIETMEGAKELLYFTHITNGSTNITPTDAPQVQATFKDSRLTLEFSLTLPQALPLTDDFKYTLFDEEYYTAFLIKKQGGYQLTGDDIDDCALFQVGQGQIDNNIKTALENAFNDDFTNQGMGAQFADDIGIKCG